MILFSMQNHPMQDYLIIVPAKNGCYCNKISMFPHYRKKEVIYQSLSSHKDTMSQTYLFNDAKIDQISFAKWP